jgi:hypothetical protein
MVEKLMKQLTPKPKSLQERIDQLELDIAARKVELAHYNELFKEKMTSPLTLSSIAVGGAAGVFLLIMGRRKLNARRIKKLAELPSPPQLESPPPSKSFFSIATLMSLSSILSTALTLQRLFLKPHTERGKPNGPRGQTTGIRGD